MNRTKDGYVIAEAHQEGACDFAVEQLRRGELGRRVAERHSLREWRAELIVPFVHSRNAAVANPRLSLVGQVATDDDTSGVSPSIFRQGSWSSIVDLLVAHLGHRRPQLWVTEEQMGTREDPFVQAMPQDWCVFSGKVYWVAEGDARVEAASIADAIQANWGGGNAYVIGMAVSRTELPQRGGEGTAADLERMATCCECVLVEAFDGDGAVVLTAPFVANS